MKSLVLLAGVLLFGAAAFGQTGDSDKVVLETSKGRIVIELDFVPAPIRRMRGSTISIVRSSWQTSDKPMARRK